MANSDTIRRAIELTDTIRRAIELTDLITKHRKEVEAAQRWFDEYTVELDQILHETDKMGVGPNHPLRFVETNGLTYMVRYIAQKDGKVASALITTVNVDRIK